MSAYADRSRWPDERLDDLAAEVIVLKGSPIRIATLTEQLSGMRRDLDNMGELIRQISGRVEEALRQLGEDEAEHRIEERTFSHRYFGHQKWVGVAQTIVLAIAALASVAALVIAGHP